MKNTDAMLRPPAAFAYLRFSTDDQRKGHSLERQIANVKAFADARGLGPVDTDSFRDLGVSAFRGTNAKEGALRHFLARVESGEIGAGDWLIVENLDRLSRQGIEQTFPLLWSITNAGVTVATAQDGQTFQKGKFDLPTFMRAAISAQLANEESTKKSDRLCAAWAAKRAKLAERKMTARAPGWLSLSADKKTFTVIPERAKIVRRVFADTAAGLGRIAIANALNVERVPVWRWGTGWTKTHVSEILSSRAVIGEFQPCKMEGRKRVPIGEPLKDYFPRIISDSDFYAASSVVRNRRNPGRASASVNNLFSRICFCGQCGGPSHYINKSRGAVYLRCDYAARRLKTCKPAAIPYRPIEAAFIRWIVNFDFSDSTKTERAQKLQELTAAKEKQEVAARKVERLTEAMSTSSLPVATFLPQIERAKGEADTAAHEVAMLTATVAGMQERAPTIDAIELAKDPQNRARLREQIRRRVRRVVVFPKFLRVELCGGESLDIYSETKIAAMVPSKNGARARVVFENVDPSMLTA